MPGLDRSGPMGAGPMTGGRRGNCNRAGTGYVPPAGGGYGYARGLGMRRGFRGGFGAGRTGRRGFGRGFDGYPLADAYGPPMGRAEERDLLRADADAMEKSLEAIRRRLGELETEKTQ